MSIENTTLSEDLQIDPNRASKTHALARLGITAAVLTAGIAHFHQEISNIVDGVGHSASHEFYLLAGRDITFENQKYQSLSDAEKKTFFILELGQEVYKGNDGNLYNAKTGKYIEPASVLDGDHYIKDPVTIYSPEQKYKNNNINTGSSNSSNEKVDPVANLAVQHITFTKEALESEQFQKIYREANDAKGAGPASLNNLVAIHKIITNDLPLDNNLNWISAHKYSPSNISEWFSYFDYELTYRRLDIVIQKGKMVCFDIAEVESAILQGLHYNVRTVSNIPMSHTYSIVTIGKQEYVADPITGEVTELQDHQKKYGYDNSRVIEIPSPLGILDSEQNTP